MAIRLHSLFWLAVISSSVFAANDMEQANSYDKDWQPAWIAHCRSVYRVIGKTRGFVLQIGDKFAHVNANASWPRSGLGKTKEDNAICDWCSATSWSTDNAIDSSNKNGWFLAVSPGWPRGMTAANMDSVGFLGGNSNSTAIPAYTDSLVARGVVEDGRNYPDNLQVDTVCAAFPDAQFAVLNIGSKDIAANRNPQGFVSNLEGIVDAFEKNHIVVILNTLAPDPDFTKPEAATLVSSYNIAIRDLARKNALPLIDQYAEILARRPETTWQNTLVQSGVGLTDHSSEFNSASNPYATGGDPATHTTGAAAQNVGYLLRSWLTIQKLKQVKTFIVDREIAELDAQIADLEKSRTQSADIKQRDPVTFALADTSAQANRTAKAAEYLDNAATEAADDKDRLSKILFQKMQLYAEPLRNYDEAAKVVGRIASECPSEIGVAVNAVARLADLALQRDDFSAAIKHYQDTLTNYSGKLNADQVTQLKIRLAGTLVKTKMFESASVIYSGLAEESSNAGTRLGYELQAARGLANAKRYEGAIKAYRKIVLENARNLNVCFDAQKAIILACQDSGDLAHAAAASIRYFYAASTPQTMEDSIQCVAQALKSLDMNLSRANAFLRFQKYGPAGEDGKLGTGDDLQNPLAALNGVPVSPDADELKALDEALTKFGNTLADRRAKGFLNLFFGRPAQAMSEFKQALLSCPVDAKSIQAAANDVSVGLKAINGHLFATDSFIEFFLYGPNGKDGKSDLVDPLKDY